MATFLIRTFRTTAGFFSGSATIGFSSGGFRGRPRGFFSAAGRLSVIAALRTLGFLTGGGASGIASASGARVVGADAARAFAEGLEYLAALASRRALTAFSLLRRLASAICSCSCWIASSRVGSTTEGVEGGRPLLLGAGLNTG